MPGFDVSISRLSRATSHLLSEDRIDWTHVTQSGMRLHLDEPPKRGQKRMMKIFHERKVLESVDFGSLCAQVTRIETEAAKLGQQPSHQDLPVFAKYRTPNIALKWKLDGGKTHRIQVRLVDTADFNVMLTELSVCGCPMLEAGSVDRSLNIDKLNSRATEIQQSRPLSAYQSFSGANPQSSQERCSLSRQESIATHQSRFDDVFNDGQSASNNQQMESLRFHTPSDRPILSSIPQSMQHRYLESTQSSSRPFTAPAYGSLSLQQALIPTFSQPDVRNQQFSPTRLAPISADRLSRLDEGTRGRHISSVRPMSSQHGRSSQEELQGDMADFCILSGATHTEPKLGWQAPSIPAPPIASPVFAAASNREMGGLEQRNQESLRAYNQQPADNRAGAIEELILACIKDDNFVTLCEDVERAWLRVGLM